MALLAPNDCLNAIVALIDAIPNSGRVYNRRRIVRTENDVRRLLFDTDNNRICAWFVSPAVQAAAVPVRHPGYSGIGVQGGGNVITTFSFQIDGYFGVDDTDGDTASQNTFWDLVWLVSQTFDSYGVIPKAGGGAIPGVNEQSPCEVGSFGYTMFAGSFLCHSAALGVAFRGRTQQ